MRREDCKVGMIIHFSDDMGRGVILKVNPKYARIKLLDGRQGARPGTLWRAPYAMLCPVVGGDEISNEMTMRSFQDPDDIGVKAWSASQMKRGEMPTECPPEDELIVKAIVEVYRRLDNLNGRARYDLSNKINLLFRAVGHEFTREEAEKFLEGTHAHGN